MKKYKCISILFCVCFCFTCFSQESEEGVSFLVIEKVPVYPGCKGNPKELKSCFSKKVQKLFVENFDMELANRIGLAGGKYKVFIGFTVSRKGDVKHIVVRAPHKKIKEEVKRVMNLIPKMIPGEAKGEKVNVKYSIPFIMEVQETRSQKRERKKKEKEARKNKV